MSRSQSLSTTTGRGCSRDLPTNAEVEFAYLVQDDDPLFAPIWIRLPFRLITSDPKPMDDIRPVSIRHWVQLEPDQIFKPPVIESFCSGLAYPNTLPVPCSGCFPMIPSLHFAQYSPFSHPSWVPRCSWSSTHSANDIRSLRLGKSRMQSKYTHSLQLRPHAWPREVSLIPLAISKFSNSIRCSHVIVPLHRPPASAWTNLLYSSICV